MVLFRTTEENRLICPFFEGREASTKLEKNRMSIKFVLFKYHLFRYVVSSTLVILLLDCSTQLIQKVVVVIILVLLDI